jgi:hypothetical protein
MNSEFREALASLGSTSRVAELFSVKPREVRRWRDGTRKVPPAVRLIAALLASDVITVGDVERAAGRVNGGVGLLSDDDVALVDPNSVAGKVVSLGKNACRFPVGDPQNNPEAFDFCRAPIERGRYCARHCAITYLPRTARVPKPRDLSALPRVRSDFDPDFADLDLVPAETCGRVEMVPMELVG